MPSAWRCRSGCPRAFTDPVDAAAARPGRRATPAPTGPFTTAERRPPARRRRSRPGAARAGRARGRRPGGARRVPTRRLEREWCDAEVLRQLRRRSLAALRKEVEPVDGAALARFLPAWQGVGSTRRGTDALVEAVGVLQGAALPASVLEADVLALRMGDYRPADLDLLCTSGELVWVGAGSVGAHDGRVRLVFRDQVGTAGAGARGRRRAGAGPGHDAVLRDATWPTEGPRSGPTWWRPSPQRRLPYDEPTVLDGAVGPGVGGRGHQRLAGAAAGEVGGGGPRPGAARCAPRGRRGRGPARPRPTCGAGARPPRPARGRRSLVAGRPAARARRPTPTEVAHARALQLLERYGVLTRETASPRASGRLRRGVPGAQGAGGAGPGPPRLLRGRPRRRPVRPARAPSTGCGPAAAPSGDDLGDDEPPTPVVLAATDPAQPYGAALPWPATGRPAARRRRLVVLVDGEACAYLERGGRWPLTLPAAAADVPTGPRGWCVGGGRPRRST